jgi:two-component system, OmpR family, sensor histidine kinase MprB
MNLRARVTLAAGGAVFAALFVASLVVYFSVRSNLHDQIDVSLIDDAQNVATKTAAAGGKLPAGTYRKSSNAEFPAMPLLGTDSTGYFQVIESFGAVAKNTSADVPTQTVTTRSGTATNEARPKVPEQSDVANPNAFVPLVRRDGLVAAGIDPPYFRDVRYHGTQMRLYTMRFLSGHATDGLVRTARPLSEANATLHRVRWLLIALTLGGAFVAALLGRIGSAAILRPVRALASTVREVTTTRDLNRRIPIESRDELGSLARDFNEMLVALEESRRRQQQLIADASHELRTPLTAHRTNIELLARSDLPAERRSSVLEAAVRGIDDLSALVNGLIEAARDGRSLDAREQVQLGDVVTASVERARRRAPCLTFTTRLLPFAISGSRPRLERAIDNVLDNAIKWSPPAGNIELTLADGALVIRDEGPGIDDADRPHAFDRFYRSASARGMPGSGLGLAIVKQTVDDHGGRVEITNADAGGTVVLIRFETLTNR